MKKLDQDFVNRVCERYLEIRQIEVDDKESLSNRLRVIVSRTAAETFAIAFNTLLREGYFQDIPEDPEK